MPKLSVVTVTFNRAKTLEKCFASVLAQNFSDMEHIIIDNMSNDETQALVADYANRANYPIVYVREPDGGIYEAMNKGINRSRGEWVHLLNSDDCYDQPQVLQEVFARLGGADVDLICNGVRQINEQGEQTALMIPAYQKSINFYNFPHPGIITKKSFYDQRGLYRQDMRIAADQAYNYEHYATAKTLILPELVLVAMANNGISANMSWLRFKEAIRCIFLLSRHPWWYRLRLLPGLVYRLIRYYLSRPLVLLKGVLPSRWKRIGYRLLQSLRFFYRWLNYRRQYKQFIAQAGATARLSCLVNDQFPQLNDNTGDTVFDHHYVYHPAWAARILVTTRPDKHVDIASTLHFCATVSAFLPVDFYDYRPAKLVLDNLASNHCDLTNLHFADNSIQSLSCMHTVEHIGLGRYGDPIDVDGDLKAIKELQRVLAIGGDLLFVVPVGAPKIMFNAHRIYSYEMIVDYFSNLELKEFAMVYDDGCFVRGANPADVAKQKYACGCFWFRKLS